MSVLTAAALSLLLGACAPVARAQDTGAVHRVTVTGQGQASATPDIATVDMGVDLVRETSQQALNDASARTQNLVRALRRAGVADRDLQTRSLQIHPQYDHREGRANLVGYRASNVLSVRIRDLARAGEVIDAAIQAAGDEAVLQGVRFELSDPTSLQREAREEAWQDATAKARQLADLANAQLGPPLTITEQSEGMSPVMLRADRMEMASTPVEPGELSVSVSLTVDFRLGTERM